jgi:hypothetical protein
LQGEPPDDGYRQAHKREAPRKQSFEKGAGHEQSRLERWVAISSRIPWFLDEFSHSPRQFQA